MYFFKDTHNTSPITHHQKGHACRQAGFTLIELLVVIAIIAILSTIGIALFANAQKGARDGKRISDLLEIQKSLEQYYIAGSRTYPTSAQYSGATFNNSTYFSTGTIPTDPTNSGGYVYTYRDTSVCGGQGYKLCAQMESTGKGNASGIPADGCTMWSAGTTYYCVTNNLN